MAFWLIIGSQRNWITAFNRKIWGFNDKWSKIAKNINPRIIIKPTATDLCLKKCRGTLSDKVIFRLNR